MSNYIVPKPDGPTYSISLQDNAYHIDVKTKIPESEQINPTIQKEVAKSSMLGIAYIHKLSSNHIAIAEQISNLYEGYKNFFADHNKNQLLDTANTILKNKESDKLVKEMALYVIAILEGNAFEETEGSLLINQLMPGIRQTFSIKTPTLLHKPQNLSFSLTKATHNAFPDLIKFQNKHYVTFREANSHVGHQDLGKIRVLSGSFNKEEQKWNFVDAGLLTSDIYDFRDPKFFVDGNKNLNLIFDGSLIDEKDKTTDMVPHVAKLNADGTWEVKKAVLDAKPPGKKGEWIWRVTWNDFNNAGYGFSYGTDSGLYLMKTKDGLTFKNVGYISNEILPKDDLNEATIRFKKDGTAVALIRTDRNGLIATASPKDKYKTWDLSIIPYRLGGPNFVLSNTDLKMWAATRYLFVNRDNTLDEATVFSLMTEKELAPLIRLQSFGDSSYPGMVMEEDGSITLVYYSSDKNNESHIYITRVQPN